MKRSSRRTRTWAGLLTGAVACNLLQLPEPAAAASPDALLIVDCLLPGRVQRLGTAATYVTARKAIKTSAADCRVRGGEYTESGQATYASLTRVWLPLARSGDTEAQTNLGEIFEKGVGGPPQYDLAVQWYRQAADNGNARAQVNLGSLYERGIGVPKDMAQALAWYRRASGLNLPLGPAPTEEVSRLRQERDALEQQLSSERRERERLQDELDAVRQRLNGERSSLQQEQLRLDEARRELVARTQTLEQQTARLAASPQASDDTEARSRLAQLQGQLEEQRRAVAERDAQLRRLQSSVAQLEARSATLQGQLSESQRQNVAELAAARSEASTARQELTAANQRLREARQELDAQSARIADQSAAVQRLRDELGRSKNAASGQDAGKLALEAQLRQREAELSESRRQLAALTSEVARLGLQTRSSQQQQATVSATAPPRISRAVDFGRYYALVIGNNKYQSIPRLETAAGDARAVADLLRSRYGFETTLLLEANRYDMLSALNNLRSTLTSNDNLLIFYAGHGTVDEESNRDYWLPVDAEANSTANWIPTYQITDFLKAIPAKQIMLVADSCYSGMLTRSAVTRLESGMTDQERLRWYETMAKKHARVVLTSGGNKPVLDGGGGGHSVFAAALLRILRDNQDVLEGQKLAQEVTQRVTVTTAAVKYDQVPTYAALSFAGHEAGDFFFVPR